MIVVDIETSGLDCAKNSILSIGAVDFSKPENQFYEECKMREGATYDPIALHISGFSVEQINDPDKQSLEDLVGHFFKWTENIIDVTLGGHNIEFDMKFLRYSFRLYNMKWVYGRRSVDTHTILYAAYLARGLEIPLKSNRTSLTSDSVFNYAGLPDEIRPHNGLNGAKMEAESISRILLGKELLEEYSKFPIPAYLKEQI